LLIFTNNFKVYAKFAVNTFISNKKQGRTMEVSAIDAIRPRQIQWQTLTAREIIKYESAGMDVPSEYLTWAKTFKNDLAASDKDEVTYEMAKKAQNNTDDIQNKDDYVKTDETKGSAVSEDKTKELSEDDAEKTGDDEEQVANEEEKSAAQSMRENLDAQGVSLRSQAKIFTSESKSTWKTTLISRALMATLGGQSDDEIESLENYMEQLLAKAEATQNELKSEVENINSGQNDESSFQKIDKLQQELQHYGVDGQSQISGSEALFDGFNTSLNAQSGVIDHAIDFGTETVDIGNDLISQRTSFWRRIINYIIGRRAISAGTHAVKRGDATGTVQSAVLSANNSNKSEVSALKAKVEAKTGVAANPAKQTKSDKDIKSDEENNEQNSITKKQQEQDEKDNENKATAAPDPIKDQLKVASADFDEIIKHKLRRGEQPEA